MCGIAGILTRQPDTDLDILERLCRLRVLDKETYVHRPGPERVWCREDREQVTADAVVGQVLGAVAVP